MSLKEPMYHPKTTRTEAGSVQQAGRRQVQEDFKRKVAMGLIPAVVVPSTESEGVEQTWTPMADVPERFTANFLAWMISIGDMERGDVGRNNQHTVLRAPRQVWRMSHPPLLAKNGRICEVQCKSLTTLLALCDDPNFFEGLELVFPLGGEVRRHAVYSADALRASNLALPRSEPSTRMLMRRYYYDAVNGEQEGVVV